MARKRKRARRRSLSAAPTVRRRRRLTMAAPRRRRRRGLSELGLVKGKFGSMANPIIEGAIGGVGTQLVVKAIPESLFTSNPSLKPYENWIKGGLLLAGAAIAAKMKQPLIAAGMAGGAAILTMQKEGILQEEGNHGGFAGRGRRSLQSARFADPMLLSDAELLNDDIYPPYVAMYESPKNEFRF